MTNNKAINKMEEWMDYRGFAESTKKNYIMHVELFSRYFQKPLSELKREHVKEYLYKEWKDKNLSASYLNLCHASIKLLYEKVFERASMMKNIPKRKNPPRRTEVMTKDEIKILISKTENIRNKAILLTIYSAGLRLSEVCNLKVSDVDSKNLKLFIRKGKGGKDRHTILAENTLKILREYYKEYRPKDWLFEGRDKGTSLSPKTVQHIFQRAKSKTFLNRKITVHTLRHSFSTHLIESGVNILVLKELLGHSCIQSTSMYVHLANRNVMNVVSPADMMGGDFQ